MLWANYSHNLDIAFLLQVCIVEGRTSHRENSLLWHYQVPSSVEAVGRHYEQRPPSGHRPAPWLPTWVTQGSH